eukprot:scaffold166152_cov13-Tisochrysis_lutea.AAC.1
MSDARASPGKVPISAWNCSSTGKGNDKDGRCCIISILTLLLNACCLIPRFSFLSLLFTGAQTFAHKQIFWEKALRGNGSATFSQPGCICIDVLLSLGYGPCTPVTIVHS